MDSLGLLLSLYVTPAKVQDRIGALLARRAKGASASFEESLGRWRLYGREVGGVAKIAGWMGIADRPAECRCRRVRRSTPSLFGEVLFSEFEDLVSVQNRLSLTLTKQALSTTVHGRINSRATFAQRVLSDLISRSGMALLLLSHHFYAIEICLRFRVRFFHPCEFCPWVIQARPEVW